MSHRRWSPGSRARVGVLVGALAGVVLAAGASRPAVAGPATEAPAAAELAAGPPVALLALDAERSLELYGQPVASELARALTAGDIGVVAVSARMAVPASALMIIDGTLTHGKAGSVTISIRLRSAINGVTLVPLSITAPGLTKLDAAAADLASRALPLVRLRLVDLRKQRADEQAQATAAAAPRAPAVPAGPQVALIGVSDGTTTGAALLPALDRAASAWARERSRQPRAIDPAKLDGRIASKAVTAGGAELALGFWVLDYEPETGAVPMARARVRVAIAGPDGVLFDRVVSTDTVLGDKGLSPGELAARVAREVLAIVRPHLLRAVPAWR